MAGLNKNWLEVVSWESVVSINAALCDARKALHKPTSDGYAPAKDLWERNRLRRFSLPELLQLCFQCHRLAPFCNYNGNTFVTIVKTLLKGELDRLPPDQAHILRSIAGHIVAGTATDTSCQHRSTQVSCWHPTKRPIFPLGQHGTRVGVTPAVTLERP